MRNSQQGRRAGATQVCHSEGHEQHRTAALLSLAKTHVEVPSSALHSQTLGRLCLARQVLELPSSAAPGSRLQGQTTRCSVTAPGHALGFALLLWSLSLSPGRCCSGSTAQRWEDCRACPLLLQATTSPNRSPNPIKLHLGSAQGFVFLATPSGRLFQSFVFLAGSLLRLSMAG